MTNLTWTRQRKDLIGLLHYAKSLHPERTIKDYIPRKHGRSFEFGKYPFFLYLIGSLLPISGFFAFFYFSSFSPDFSWYSKQVGQMILLVSVILFGAIFFGPINQLGRDFSELIHTEGKKKFKVLYKVKEFIFWACMIVLILTLFKVFSPKIFLLSLLPLLFICFVVDPIVGINLYSPTTLSLIKQKDSLDILNEDPSLVWATGSFPYSGITSVKLFPKLIKIDFLVKNKDTFTNEIADKKELIAFADSWVIIPLRAFSSSEEMKIFSEDIAQLILEAKEKDAENHKFKF